MFYLHIIMHYKVMDSENLPCFLQDICDHGAAT